MSLKDIICVLPGMVVVSILFVIIVLSGMLFFHKDSAEPSCSVPELTRTVHIRLLELQNVQEDNMTQQQGTKAQRAAKEKENNKKYRKDLADADEKTILMKTNDQVEQYGDPAQHGYYDPDEEE